MVSKGGFSHIYLSPHLDDAVLSCGGRIWQQTRAGESVAVVTVFGGVPPTDRSLSAYARELHARWRQPAEAVGERRREDREALALLGAEAVHWRYRDCIYRTTPGGEYAYTSEAALWGSIHPSEIDLIQELLDRIGALSPMGESALYAPLAVGGHVDHRIVRKAAERWGQALTCYEDFPYAAEPGMTEAALSGERWTAELVCLSSEALEAKIAAIARYGSQISTFWGGRAEMAASVRAFAESTGTVAPAERYWRPRSGP